MKISVKYILLCGLAMMISLVMMSCSANKAQNAPSQVGTSSTAPTAAETVTTTPTDTAAPKTTAATTTQTTTQTTVKTTAATTTQTTAATTAATTPEVTNAPPVSTAPQSVPAVDNSKPWKETALDKELYVNTYCFSRARAEIGSAAVNAYYSNQMLKVVAVTDTGYYKLENGEYIHTDFLSDGYYVTFNTTSSKYEAAPIPKKPPANTEKTCEYYDPRKSLAYAAEQWDSGIGHCAAFGQACIAAGGIHGLTDIGATPLYNQLLASGLGFAVEISRDEEGYIRVPDYAFPGDIMLFYCPKENCMVHTLIYNGTDKEGCAKAYAHNEADDGQQALEYYSFCPDWCGADIDNLALFCWYRNPDVMKMPDDPPTLTVKTKNTSADFDWEADFLYSSSELVVLNKSGKEVYRGKMGTDTEHSLTFYSTEQYTAYVEMYIGSEITVKSNEVKFNVPKAAAKPAATEKN